MYPTILILAGIPIRNPTHSFCRLENYALGIPIRNPKEPLELRLGRTRDPAGGVRHVSWHVGDTPRPTEVVGRRSSALEGRAGKQKAQGRTNNSS